jgi:hypothetical protein
LRTQEGDGKRVQQEDQHLDDRGPDCARYMSPTERPSWSASTTSTSDGGISCVMVPEAAITPVA